MLGWDGNAVTLPFAVPRNVRYTHDIKKTACIGNLGIGDRKMIYPDDKFDVDNEEFIVRNDMDIAELNEIADLAIYIQMVNNGARTIIL